MKPCAELRGRAGWRVRLERALDAVASAFLPARCIFCGAADAPEGVCTACREDLPGRNQLRCPVCAIEQQAAQICGACLQRQPAYDAVHAAYSYAFPLDAVIQRFKYAPDLTLVAPLGALLAERAPRDPGPDLLVPMPSSTARLRSRGFNQAAELARIVARRLALPLALEAAQRVRDAPPQASLPWEERAHNVRGAFACAADLSGLRVAIVDDVMTTGATLEELASVLKRGGAREVTAWVLARTPRI
jgi:ComF family protein